MARIDLEKFRLRRFVDHLIDLGEVDSNVGCRRLMLRSRRAAAAGERRLEWSAGAGRRRTTSEDAATVAAGVFVPSPLVGEGVNEIQQVADG